MDGFGVGASLGRSVGCPSAVLKLYLRGLVTRLLPVMGRNVDLNASDSFMNVSFSYLRKPSGS